MRQLGRPTSSPDSGLQPMRSHSPDDERGKQGNADSLLYSIKDVAVKLSISRSLAYELVASGELPAIRIASKLLVKREDLGRYLDNLEYTRPTKAV